MDINMNALNTLYSSSLYMLQSGYRFVSGCSWYTKKQDSDLSTIHINCNLIISIDFHL